MALESIQQLEKLIAEAKKVLIFLPENPDGDAIGAGWAFYFFLEKKGIEPILAFSDKIGNAKKFDFLPHPKNISDEIVGARDFILSFSTRYNKIMGFRTEKGEEDFKIFITQEKGSIDPRDFSFIPAKFKYDLVVVLGSPDKESLGKLYESNPDVFYEMPVVNIDYHSGNENYGQINIVEMNASSVSELLAGIIEKLNSFSIDKKIADCLLAGILSATESFQNKNTTPKSLKLASLLMDLGADQQNIVKHMYKTQPFHVLKLWGRIMARLKIDEEHKITWAPVYLEDFVQSRSKPEDVSVVLSKLKENYSGGLFFLLFYSEAPNVIR